VNSPTEATSARRSGFGFLAATEALNAFALYGTLSLLVLYLSGELLKPERVGAVVGLGGFTALLQSLFGKLSTIGLASQLFGFFAGFICFTPLAGGAIADRLTGQRVAVAIGLVLMLAGYSALTSAPFFLVGLLLIGIGSGCATGNLKVQIGNLYGDEGEGRPRAFALDLAGINAGAFAGPLVCGTLAAAWGWSAGFAAPALAAAAALAAYAAGWRRLPGDVRGGAESQPQSGGASAAVPALIALIALNILYFGTYNQTFNMLAIWARDAVDRDVGFEVQVPWLLALDGLFGIAAALGVYWLWKRQARRGSEPDELRKLIIGFTLLGLAFLSLDLGALTAGAGKASLAWCIPYFLLVAAAAPFIFSTTLALISRHAPARWRSLIMGSYVLSAFAGNLLVGWSGGWYERMPAHLFWGLHAAFAGLGAVLLLVFKRRLSARLSA
jgi:POT family proton-dependent oligopeptide transporter